MIVSVLAKPNSKIDKAEWKDQVLHVKIKAKPVDGEANAYLIRFLSKIFSVPQSNIEISKGLNSRNKIVKIQGDENLFNQILTQLMA